MASGPAQPGERTRARQWYKKGATITHIATQMGRPRETIRDWVADLRSLVSK